MLKIETCVAKATKFNVIRITNQLGDEIQQAFKKAAKLDERLDRPENYWAATHKYHGLTWTDIWGFEFIANYGAAKQGRRQTVSLDDRIIEDTNGDQFLIHRDLFERYFI